MRPKLTPEVGERHGKRTIIQIEVPSPDTQQRVKVVCECGREDIVPYYKLPKGQRTSCPSCRTHKGTQDRREQLVGKRFGERTVVEVFGDAKGCTKMNTICDQGHVAIIAPHEMENRLTCRKCQSDRKSLRKQQREEAKLMRDARPKPALSTQKLRRQARVLAYLEKGVKQKDIASLLGLSLSTVGLIKNGRA